MINLDKQNELFTLIGENLRDRVECYVIGGSAMLYYGMKITTKDIDLVFDSENDKDKIEKVLMNLGYKHRETRLIYFKKKNVPVLLQREQERFDLFVKRVIILDITSTMKERIAAVYEFGNFIVKVVSPEDIILLKCATERAGDRLDALEIMKKKDVNWDVVIEESIKQTKIDSTLFPVFLYDFLTELKEDLKADIPRDVINKVRDIGEELMIKRLKKNKS